MKNSELKYLKQSLKDSLIAAEQGDDEAMYSAVCKVIIEGYDDDAEIKDLVIRYLTILADKGYGSSMVMLASYYERGEGVKQNGEKAIELYTKAVAQGIKYGNECIGCIYFWGWGVAKDYAKAWKYFNKSRKKMLGSSPNSWYVLGEMYRQGLGVEVDFDAAWKYYQKITSKDIYEADAYYLPALFQLSRLMLRNKKNKYEIDLATKYVQKVKKGFYASVYNNVLHQCISKEELETAIRDSEQAKEAAPHNYYISVDHQLSLSEFLAKIEPKLLSLRPLEDEFLVLQFKYKHPYNINFIQAACCFLREGEIVEISHYEQPVDTEKYRGKILTKLYRLEPIEDVSFRDVIEVFRRVVLAEGPIDLKGWSDVSVECSGSEYIDVL